MKYSAYFFWAGVLLSCSSGNKNNASITDTVQEDLAKPLAFDKGLVHERITCAVDTSINYALYLPKQYSVNKQNPVIYFFDSHGNGRLPLEKYKGLAEKYGYVLAGSNTSRNGINWEQNRASIKIFMEDVKARLKIDNKRVYTCGFSGGSRVASSVAIVEGGINCVIAMGAGLPNVSEPIHNRFDYIGFAGNEDFNMNEMVSLLLSMDKFPIRHQLIITDGKHEWISAETAEDAFVWLELNAMKDGLISKNDSLLNSFCAKKDSILQVAIGKNDIYREFLLYKMQVNYLDGLKDVSEFKKKAGELSNTDGFKNLVAKKEALSKEEFTRQGDYRSNLVLKDLKWWKYEIDRMNYGPGFGRDNRLMNKRLMGYLGLVVYMNASAAWDSRQLELMEKFLKIYQLAEPENPEHQYLFADLYILKKDSSRALSSLRDAVKLGFKDLERIEADTVMLTLRNSPGYNAIIRDMKANRNR